MTVAPPASDPAQRPYPLDNRHPCSSNHHDSLARMLDPFTRYRIESLGDWTGTRVMEVGAGGGSVALWLADLVGPTGSVVATDLKPELPEHPQMTVVAHDLTGDEPLPEGGFDLIHARLVVQHLPGRELILHRLAQRLAPGGILLTEDWAALRADMVVHAPSPEAAELYTTYQRLTGKLFDSVGTDPTWAKRVHRAMVDEGLVEVETQVHSRYWYAGAPGGDFVLSTLPQLRPKLLANGSMTEQQLDELVELLADPRLLIQGHPLYSVSGRRPAAG